MAKRTICLDFDGVLHSYTSGWRGPAELDEPTPGAKRFVELLTDSGFDVVVQSTRASTTEGYLAMRQWFSTWGFPQDLRVVVEKPKAMLYIDDRGFRFEGDFNVVLEYIVRHPALGTWNHP